MSDLEMYKLILMFLKIQLDLAECSFDSMRVDRLVIAIEAIEGEINALG